MSALSAAFGAAGWPPGQRAGLLRQRPMRSRFGGRSASLLTVILLLLNCAHVQFAAKTRSSSPADLRQSLAAPVVLVANGHQVLELVSDQRKIAASFSTFNRQSSVLAFDADLSSGSTVAIVANRSSDTTRNTHLIAFTTPSSADNGDIRYRPAPSDNMTDVAIDWVTKNVYLLDAHRAAIVVCSFGGTSPICADVFTNLGELDSLVVDPLRGRMFWIQDDMIYQGLMDGEARWLFVAEEASQPHSLAIDVVDDKLYWLEGSDSRVDYIDLGDNERGHVDLPRGSVPFQLAVSQNKLYWSSSSSAKLSVRSCTKLRCKDTKTIARSRGKTAGGPTQLRVYQKSMRPDRYNPCERRPCSHICVLSGPRNNDFTCLCPRYFSLVSATQCRLTTPSFLIASGKEIFTVPADVALDPRGSSRNWLDDLKVPAPHLIAMAADEAQAGVFGVDYRKLYPRIVRISLNDGHLTELVKLDARVVPSSLHFDSLHRILYWLDVSDKTVVLYNPDHNETTRRRLYMDDTDVHNFPLDFAVDFRRGRWYVVVLDSKTGDHIIEALRLDGKKREHRLTVGNLSVKPQRIAVDQADGHIIVFDSNLKSIFAMNVDTGTTWQVASNVSDMQHLQCWQNRVVWSDSARQGFFSAPLSPGDVLHTVQESWTWNTSAISFVGDRLEPISTSGGCRRNGGNCSHTCLDTIEEGFMICLCPDDMELGKDGKTCKDVADPVTPVSICLSDEFECATRIQCVPASLKCDGVPHCDDASDEATKLCGHECPINSHRCPLMLSTVAANASTPSASSTQLLSSSSSSTSSILSSVSFECLPLERTCDGRRDCADGSDEDHCLGPDDDAASQANGPPRRRLTDIAFDSWRAILAAVTAISLAVITLAGMCCICWREARSGRMKVAVQQP